MGLRPRQHHLSPALHQGQLGLTQRNGHAVEGQLVLVQEGDGTVRGRAQPLAELFLPGVEGRLITAAGGAVQVVAQVQGQGRVNQLDDGDGRFGGCGQGEKGTRPRTGPTIPTATTGGKYFVSYITLSQLCLAQGSRFPPVNASHPVPGTSLFTETATGLQVFPGILCEMDSTEQYKTALHPNY